MSEASDKLFTPIYSRIESKRQLHLNNECSDKKSVQLGEATFTYDGVLLATTGEKLQILMIGL